ncbi:MAG TPA: peptidylprolyl isomerase, partial [Ignavibacteriaceae bacterium]|nr:peptidylprolyl isomerase [Ignavibacteriaceae bacterium]
SIILSGCEKEKVKKDFVARVNNSYLTKEQLSSLMAGYSGKNYYKEEVIRNWINQELLYQEAVKNGILKEKAFNSLLDNSKKELAISLFLEKHFNDEKPSYDPKEVEDYYTQHQNEFAFFYDTYYLNIADFKNENKAIKFRTLLFDSDWEKALNVFKADSSINKVRYEVLLNDYQIQPVSIQRIVSQLNPQEVSIVINYQPGHYVVVQKLQTFNKGTVPPFNVIKSEVEKRFLAKMKNDFLQSYIKDIYTNNDIEVKN